jgi:hypothetical protein
MTTTRATLGSEILPRNPEPTFIEENSLLTKALSYIPLIGIIPSVIQQNSLANKISSTRESPKLIELINVKNQYKIASTVRILLTAALIIVGIAFGILSGPLAFGMIGSPLLSGTISTILLTGVVGFNIYGIHQNNKFINELRSTGFREGVRVF